MSKLNVNQWTDRTGREMDIGQRVVAIRGKTLHVGEILWFTKSGVTIASEQPNGETHTISIGIYNDRIARTGFLIL